MNFDSSEVLAVIYTLQLTAEFKKRELRLEAYLFICHSVYILPNHKLLVVGNGKSFNIWVRPRPLVSSKHLGIPPED